MHFARVSHGERCWRSGVTQITAWGTIFYLFALIMEPLQSALVPASRWWSVRSRCPC